MLRWLRALRPFLAWRWLLGTALATGFLVIGADAWIIVAEERGASAMRCDAWPRSAPRPAWVRLHDCQLLPDRRIALRPSNSLPPGKVLVPLAVRGAHRPPVAYVLLPADFDQDASLVAGDRFAGLVYPLASRDVPQAVDSAMSVLHPDEPSVWRLMVTVVPAAWLVVAFARRMRVHLQAVDASERLAERARRTAPATGLDIVDISPLPALQRAVLFCAPGWAVLSMLAVASPESILPFSRTVALAAGVGAALTILATVVIVWRRARPSRVAWAAILAPSGLVALGVAGLRHASDAFERAVMLGFAAYGLLAIVLLARALFVLQRSPARARLLEIEREWLWTRRQMRIRLSTRRARLRYLVLHGLGILCAVVAAVVMLAAGIHGLALAVALGVFYAFRVRAQRHALPDAAEALAQDTRMPVLYLRSFLDEELVVQSHSYQRDRSISEWVAAQFNLVGPVIAIARPGERLPQMGPYRVRVPPLGDWQAEVRRSIDLSAQVVLMFGITPGLLWELGQLAGSGALNRTCFVFPPVDSLELDERWQQIDEHAAIVPPLQALGSVDPHRLLMARIGGDQRLTVLCSTIRSSASYEMAFADLWMHQGLDAAASPTAKAALA